MAIGEFKPAGVVKFVDVSELLNMAPTAGVVAVDPSSVLTVAEITASKASYDVTGNITATGSIDVGSTLKVGTTSNLVGNATLGGTASVTGAATIGGAASIVGNATFGGTASITGATKLGSTLAVTGNSTLGGTASVTGNTTLGGTTALVGDATATGYILGSTADTLTAHAGGGQASATQLSKQLNHITVCATAADSVKLPVSVAGMSITVRNDGAKDAQVFGTSPDTINGVATGTGVALTAASSATYRCFTAGKWFT